MTKKQGINWFRLNRSLHRDFGYLVIGFTLVFAVSGIALNHVRDWNPNYQVERIEREIVLASTLPETDLNKALLAAFPIDDAIKASYWESRQRYKLFFEGGGTLSLNFARNHAVFEKLTERPVFKQFNTLHLNEVKAGWIVFSDIYAGLLIFLSISALFMVKGKYSPWRMRKGWLVLSGIAIPLVYMFI